MNMSNIIDYKPYMENDHKVYVEVNENRLTDGRLIPLSFVWEDGNRYEVDKVIDTRHAASLKAGGAGLRYTVMVRNRQTYMFLEEDRAGAKWFMERK
jgi:hypothetical protein